MILLIAILIMTIPMSFAIGFNYGVDRQGDLKEFNDKKYRYMNRVLND